MSVRDQRSGSWEETSKSLFRANEKYKKAIKIYKKYIYFLILLQDMQVEKKKYNV